MSFATSETCIKSACLISRSSYCTDMLYLIDVLYHKHVSHYIIYDISYFEMQSHDEVNFILHVFDVPLSTFKTSFARYILQYKWRTLPISVSSRWVIQWLYMSSIFLISRRMCESYELYRANKIPVLHRHFINCRKITFLQLKYVRVLLIIGSSS